MHTLKDIQQGSKQHPLLRLPHILLSLGLRESVLTQQRKSPARDLLAGCGGNGAWWVLLPSTSASTLCSDIIYRDGLAHLSVSSNMLEVVHTLTCVQPPAWAGYDRRIDIEMVQKVAWPLWQQPLVFVCSPTQFVGRVVLSLVELGYEPEHIKTERFG
ncbi:hypothetical protein KSB_51070 [Ktedonobacter robiniae]|uniref:Uncharacterized protein n=1 Tax=Ktedonobacter robiniae TaxID=2778365 RepID=A0ABQ3UVB1_9CHLR|nr:hypothetical protein KSB_51070 [Ktedonobacter robiniae]